MQKNKLSRARLNSAVAGLAILAGLTILPGCATNMSSYDTNSASKAESVSGKMYLPATTESTAAYDYYMSGWADFENARNVTAYEKFEKALAADPDFTAAHFMAAFIAPSTQSFVSHVQAGMATTNGKPEGETVMIEALGRFLANDAVGGLNGIKQLTELYPESPRAWNFLGAAYANIDDTKNARAALKKVIELDPEFVPGYINLGNNYLGLEPKNFDKAEKLFKKAIALTPNEPNPYDLLGDVHRAQNNLEAAYDDYTKAAELAPELGSGVQQRGHVNSFLGRYDEARADYTKAAMIEEARGSFAAPGFMTFKAYVNLHEGNHGAAISELQAIADGLEGADFDGAADTRIGALWNVAMIAAETGRMDTAKAAIKEASALQNARGELIGSEDVRNADRATQLYFKGMLAAKMGDTEKAMAKAAAFEEQVANNTNPRKLERMHHVLGLSAYQSGDYVKAAKHLAQGDTDFNMQIKYYLARALEQTGNSAEAARLYDEMAVYNFNGPAYAMFRKDILARASKS